MVSTTRQPRPSNPSRDRTRPARTRPRTRCGVAAPYDSALEEPRMRRQNLSGAHQEVSSRRGDGADFPGDDRHCWSDGGLAVGSRRTERNAPRALCSCRLSLCPRRICLGHLASARRNPPPLGTQRRRSDRNERRHVDRRLYRNARSPDHLLWALDHDDGHDSDELLAPAQL